MVKRVRNIFLCLLMTVVFAGMFVSDAYAQKVPYRGYSYDNMPNVHGVPARIAYVPVGSINGLSMGIGEFIAPQEMHIYEGIIYISDSGNNRIVLCDREGNLIRVVDSFDNNGETDTFNRPNGISIPVGLDRIYLCDTNNNRILIFDMDFNLIDIISSPPPSESLPVNFVFLPQKITVDSGYRAYVQVRNVTEGLMCFDDAGNFIGYFGTIKVSLSAADIFWRMVSTKEQRAKQTQFVATEFTNVDIDPEGFIFATNIDRTGENRVKLLNSFGKDVLKNYSSNSNRYIIGDLIVIDLSASSNWMTAMLSDSSTFYDVRSRSHGMYSVVDQRKCRVFTYDQEGNLLYIFGGVGSQLGMFRTPVAIDLIDDDIFVLDDFRSLITIFEPTLYGNMINEATRLRYEGQEDQAVSLWEEVLRLDNNYMLAYVGIGKSLLANGDNEGAMQYLRAGYDLKYYSVAYRRYRSEVLNETLPTILSVAFVLIIALVVWSFAKKFIRKRKMKGVEALEPGRV